MACIGALRTFDAPAPLTLGVRPQRRNTMDASTSLLITAISAAVAALSALVGVWNFQREQLNQKITTAKWRREYFSDLLRWSDDAMHLLSEAFHLCELDPKRMEAGEYFELRHKLRVELSAQIDRGRWFFPNYMTEQYGQHKHEAFQGYRHAVLDGLVHTYQEVSKLDYSDATKNGPRRMAIEQAKRLFTSEIQKVLDPRTRDEEFRKLTSAVTDSRFRT